MKITVEDTLNMSVEDRLQLVGDIWDSIASDLAEQDLSPELIALLERRIADHRANPDAAIPWETVRDELLESR
jgi:putative addiction module component (TIGR02574 family)